MPTDPPPPVAAESQWETELVVPPARLDTVGIRTPALRPLAAAVVVVNIKPLSPLLVSLHSADFPIFLHHLRGRIQDTSKERELKTKTS